MSNHPDRTILGPVELRVLEILDQRLWTPGEIERAAKVAGTTERIEVYCALGLLRSKGLVEAYPSPTVKRLYTITDRGLAVRREHRQQQLQMAVVGGEQ